MTLFFPLHHWGKFLSIFKSFINIPNFSRLCIGCHNAQLNRTMDNCPIDQRIFAVKISQSPIHMFAEKAIMDAFARLLDQMPLDKITVQDIITE